MRLMKVTDQMRRVIKKRKFKGKKKQRMLDMMQSPRSKVWISNDYIGRR